MIGWRERIDLAALVLGVIAGTVLLLHAVIYP